VKDDWVELRATAGGVLDRLGYGQTDPPADARLHEGIFSVLIDEGGGRTRALPTLYHGRTQVFADRSVDAIGPRVERALEAIAAQDEDATYMANAVRIGDRFGLYTRDTFNRSSFRIHMKRLGVAFAEDPYVVLEPGGTFTCRDWGRFTPEFMVAGGPYEGDEEDVTDRRGGLAPFMFGVLRIGQIAAPELALLARFVRTSPVLSSRSPQAVVATLKAA
jgi:hypothetical protein